MGVIFNADEALGMAEQIERNGRSFYLKASEAARDEAVKKLCEDLAEWEKGHEEIFKSLRSELSDEERTSTAFDPEGEGELYLQAMADTHVFNVHKDVAGFLTGKEPPAELLRKALDFERDSILFFLGLKDMVPQRLGPGKVDKIVKEEIKHVAYLNRELAKLRQS